MGYRITASGKAVPHGRDKNLEVDTVDIVHKTEKGAKLTSKHKVVDHTLSTGGLTSTVTGLFPDGGIVRGVSTRILTTLAAGDRDTVSIGISGTAALWGTKAALTAGTIINPADGATAGGPILNNAAVDGLITLSGGSSGNITAGKVRITVWYDEISGDTAA